MSKSHPTKLRIIEPLLLFVVIGIAILYVVNALNTGDWLWFQSKSVDAHPTRIVIVHDGERTTLGPGHDNFIMLSEAVHEAISRPNNTDLINLGVSEESLAYFESEGVLLELYFDRPVKFHTIYRTGDPTQILVPIEGRHAGNGYFFRGAHGEWWFGAMRMSDPTPLYEAMSSLGYPVDTGPTATN